MGETSEAGDRKVPDHPLLTAGRAILELACTCAGTEFSHVRKLDENIQCLTRGMEELRIKSVQLKERVEQIEAQRQLVRTGVVTRCLVDAVDLEEAIAAIRRKHYDINKYPQKTGLGQWWSALKLSCSASQKVTHVEYLKRKIGDLEDREIAQKPRYSDSPSWKKPLLESLSWKKPLLTSSIAEASPGMNGTRSDLT